MGRATDRQVGGSHYQGFAIQPIEFIEANGLTYSQGAVIKYLLRHDRKNGKQDLEKAIHYIEMMIERDYPDGQAEKGLVSSSHPMFNGSALRS